MLFLCSTINAKRWGYTIGFNLTGFCSCCIWNYAQNGSQNCQVIAIHFLIVCKLSIVLLHSGPGFNKIFRKSSSHVKCLGSSWLACSKFHTEDLQMPAVTVQNSVAWATWRPGFVHPCSTPKHLEVNSVSCWLLIFEKWCWTCYEV